MRNLTLVLMFAAAISGMAIFYETESRKTRGVLDQMTQMQAEVGDLKAELKRVSAELAEMKLDQRRQGAMKAVVSNTRPAPAATVTAPVERSTESSAQRKIRRLPEASDKVVRLSDGTDAGPVINSNQADEDAAAEEAFWNAPTVDAERLGEEEAEEAATDPYLQ